MSVLGTIWKEAFGLFVDDGAFAAVILIWLTACRFVLPRLGLPAMLPPTFMAAGLIAILVESALRRARRGG